MEEKTGFLFRMSNFKDPILMEETAELLRQRLEAKSRQTAPGVWKVTDKVNALPKADSAAQTRRRKGFRVFGVLLIALGVFALVPGLMPPRVPSLIWAGGWAIFAGLFSFNLAKSDRTPRPPASCRKEAASLLKLRRETDWKAHPAEIRFDGGGWTATTESGKSREDYRKLRGVFESQRLWLLEYGKDMALLLQKKDLVEGEAGAFSAFLQEKLAEREQAREKKPKG